MGHGSPKVGGQIGNPSDAAAGSLTATRLASGSGDGSVQIWDPATGQRTLPPIQAHGGYVRGVAFHPTQARLATAATDGTLKLWDVDTGQEVLSLQGHSGGVTCVAFSRDGTRLVSSDTDGTVRIWDARPWTPEIQVEREALGLLDALFAKPLGKAEVIAYLRSSPTVRPEARDKALALVDRYREELKADH